MKLLLIPIMLYASTTICTASVHVPKGTSFQYAPHVLVLDVPEYNNATTKTAGFPGCFTGARLLGWSSKPITGGFTLDNQSNFNTL